MSWQADEIQLMRVVGRKIYLVVRMDLPRRDLSSPIAVLRFDRRGKLDGSFGRKGAVLLMDTAVDGVGIYELVETPDGDVVLAGDYYEETSDSNRPEVFWSVVVRLNHDGSRDRRFGRRGLVGGPSRSVPVLRRKRLFTLRSVAALPGGRLLLGGTSRECARLVALTRTGRVEPKFGHDGLVVLRAPGGACSTDLDGWLVDKQHRIITMSDQGIIRRFGPRGATDEAFGGGDGVIEIEPVVTDPEQVSLSQEDDGSLTVFGGHGSGVSRWDGFKFGISPDGLLTFASVSLFELFGLPVGYAELAVSDSLVAYDNELSRGRAILLHSTTETGPPTPYNTEVFVLGNGHPREAIAVGDDAVLLADVVGENRRRLIVERFKLR